MYVSRNNITIFSWFVILLGLAAFKGISVGVDYPMYYGFFLHKHYIGLLEPGVSVIYDIAVRYNSFYIFSIGVYFLFLFFIFYGIRKNSPNYLISIFFFVIMHIYYNGYNQIRQLISVSILFCFANYLISNKRMDKIKYIFVILLALLFHNSAIFLFTLLFIPKKKLKPIVVIPLFLISCVFYFIPSIKNQIGEIMVFVSGFYGEKYGQGSYNFFGVNKEKGLLQFIPVFIQMVIVVISLYLSNPKVNLGINDRLYQFSANAVIVNLCLYSLAGIEAIDRLQIYFSCFNIYFYSYLVHLLLNDKQKLNGQIFVIIIIAFWILYYILRLMINVHGIVPYSFFFS
ncbi:EpsG family protein [Bacillus sp. CGMCC 1.16607]|uniref:EpsG family protein n=1 Tax=Bacillus sp. CGMCC 1.16607 TaxID=3351842 RepID=UPI003630B78B